ncbi:MAG: potassium-transporting ATPase subunit KdpC [Bacteriovorax sp.]
MKILINNLKIFLFFIVLTGIVYPFFITVVSQAAFNDEANGSLITKNGKVIGSKLLAQEFKGNQYFWPRPSASNYDPLNSAASNLSPDSKTLHAAIAKRAADNGLDIKSNDDLLYSSGSGLDPHISPESLDRQINRIAMARHLDERKVIELKRLVSDNIEGRQFGILGRERLNVLRLNLLLDEKF